MLASTPLLWNKLYDDYCAYLTDLKACNPTTPIGTATDASAVDAVNAVVDAIDGVASSNAVSKKGEKKSVREIGQEREKALVSAAVEMTKRMLGGRVVIASIGQHMYLCWFVILVVIASVCIMNRVFVWHSPFVCDFCDFALLVGDFVIFVIFVILF